MAFCKIVDALYSAVPSRLFRNMLIRSHHEKCERCQARLLSQSEAAALFVRAADIEGARELWEKMEPRIRQAVPAPVRRPAGLGWEWAAGASILLAVAAAGFWLLQGVQTAPVRVDYARPADRFEINYINVGGLPARAFIYQPQGSDMVIVWAEKNP